MNTRSYYSRLAVTLACIFEFIAVTDDALAAEAIYTRAVINAAWEPVTKRLYASRGNHGPVVLIESSTGEEQASIDVKADDIAFRSDGLEMWIANQIDDAVEVVNTNPGSPTYHQVIATIPGLPNQPVTIACTRTGTAYVSCNGGQTTVAIDMASRAIIKQIEGTGSAQSISLGTDHKRAYLANVFRVIVINTDPLDPDFNTVEASYRVPGGDAWHAETADAGNVLYVFGESFRKYTLDQSQSSRTIPTVARNSSGGDRQASGEILLLGSPAKDSEVKELWVTEPNTDLVAYRETVSGTSYFGVVAGEPGAAFPFGFSGIAR